MAVATRNPYHRLASMWAIKGKPKGTSPTNYFRRHLPRYCLLTTRDLAGPRIHYVLRFESLLEDWAELCDDLGIDAPLPHANKQVGVDDAILREVYTGDHRPYWFVRAQLYDDLREYGYEAPDFAEK
jgi:hypothetical protein